MRDIDDYRRSLHARLEAWAAALERSPLQLEGAGLGTPAGWFLGPKAENAELFGAAPEAVPEHVYGAGLLQPDDPVQITEKAMHRRNICDAVGSLKEELRRSTVG